MTYLDPAATMGGAPVWPMWILRGLQAAVVFVILYNLVVYLGGLRNPRPVPRQAPRFRFAVLIPAHNEEAVIGPLIESLLRQEYPRELYDVFVVADNCTDGTAAAARAANGADCMSAMLAPAGPRCRPPPRRFRRTTASRAGPARTRTR